MSVLNESDWKTLANAFRTEIQEYGGLLQLIEQQQQAILKNEVDGFSLINAGIENQMNIASSGRMNRHKLYNQILDTMNLDLECSFEEFLNHLPVAPRSMFEAFREEGQNMLKRIQRYTRQNKMLLSRASQMSQDILTLLQPGTTSRTYGANGQMAFKMASGARQVRTIA